MTGPKTAEDLDPSNKVDAALLQLLEAGDITLEDGVVTLTEKGRAYANALSGDDDEHA